MFTTVTARLAVFAMIFGLALAACRREGENAAAPPAGAGAAAGAGTVKMGVYRAVLKLPGGDLPFGLELAQKDSQTIGYLINGQERLLLNEVTIAGSHLEIQHAGLPESPQRRCDGR